MAPKFLCIGTRVLGGGHPRHNGCESLSISPPANMQKGSSNPWPCRFLVSSSLAKQEKKRLEASPYVSIIQEVILGDNKRE